ncbi:MAG TPA: hypothetical protein VGL72_09190 [Bryobacteraceae bacterium]|jgi:hypothetical protein
MHEMDLDQALRDLSQQCPPMPRAREMEAGLLQAFDARRSARERRLWPPALALALAASLAVFGFLHDLRGRPGLQRQVVFIAIPYTIPPAPYERTSVVRMDVEVAALTAAGFQIPAVQAGATIPADVLLAQDGRAVAIRPLTVPIL